MRDRETIDSELRRIASLRRSMREQGGQPSSGRVDELLDERLGHRPEGSETGAAKARDTDVVVDTSRDLVETHITPHRRKTVPRRFGPLLALPLSLLALAVAAVFVMTFVVHHPDPAAQPTVVPPDSPSSALPNPAVPKTPAPPVNIVDNAFIAVLKHDGVPVPSQDYVLIHGHAVCDFLTHQANFAEAVRFVQRSSVWDADQSANFTAAAVVSYCPQYEFASPGETQQAYQNALSDLQAIQGRLHGIQDDLQGIRDALPDLPGHE
jgi:hypothetical protein